MPEREYIKLNAQSRERIGQLIARLRPEDYSRPVGADWTVGGLLAHIAFWDNMALTRWEQAAPDQAPRPLDQIGAELLNTAQLAHWNSLPPDFVAREVPQVAAAVDARLEKLSAAQVDAALAADMVRLVERVRHRNEHLDEIDRALKTG